jgi:predicted metal-dependent peptidase
MNKVEIALTKMLLSTDPAMVSDACAIRCLKLVLTEKVDTAATDGVVLLVNPGFAESLSIDELTGLLVHEVCHVRFLHTERFEAGEWLDHDRANKSMDREINPIVRDAGYKLPSGGCWPYQISQPEKLSWEEYYAHEKAEQPQPQPQDSEQGEGDSSEAQDGQQSDEATGDGESEGQESESSAAGDSGSDSEAGAEGQPSSGKVESGVHAPGKLVEEFAPELLEGEEAVEPAEIAKEVAAAIDDVAEASKIQPPQVSKHTAGTGAGNQRLRPDGVIEATCDWHEVVISLVATRAKGESVADWSRPHRRSVGTGTFRPRRKKVSGLRLALVLDVSGSCVQYFAAWQTMARKMVDEVSEITELEILYHDEEVTGRELWSRRDGDEVSLETNGGGGTAFRPVLAEVESLDVDGAILFTDAEGSWPASCSVDCITVQPPGSYVVPPFGKTVRIKAWQ